MTHAARTRLFLSLFLFLSLTACRVVVPAPAPTALPPTHTVAPPSPTHTEPLPPTRTPSPSPTLTQTLTLTPAPTLTATPTVALGDTQAHLEIFEQVWELVNQEYVSLDFNGVDWDAVRERYRPVIEAGQPDLEFYVTMNEMLGELGDEHSRFDDPQTVAEDDAGLQGNLDYVGVGILVQGRPEKNYAVILVTFPGGPAEEAGIRSRDHLLAADGVPILDEQGELRDIVRGPEGTPVELTIQTPGEPPREVSVVRRRISGSIPIEYQVFESGGKRIGYVFLPTFNDLTIPGQVKEALEEMSLVGALDGLIIDNRMNEGGAEPALRETLRLFVGGRLGEFISRREERLLEVEAEDVGGSQSVPLVVLIGAGTVSYGEIFSGLLQVTGRATLMGQTTLGNVETIWGYDMPDGSRAWIARETFRPAGDQEANWEQSGIQPDIPVAGEWEEFKLEDDPVVEAAMQFVVGQSGRARVLQFGAVSYLRISQRRPT